MDNIFDFQQDCNCFREDHAKWWLQIVYGWLQTIFVRKAATTVRLRWFRTIFVRKVATTVRLQWFRTIFVRKAATTVRLRWFRTIFVRKASTTVRFRLVANNFCTQGSNYGTIAVVPHIVRKVSTDRFKEFILSDSLKKQGLLPLRKFGALLYD
jgi:hypothetical protein